MFSEDSGIAGGTVWKFWATGAEVRTEITVLYLVSEQTITTKKQTPT